MAQEKQRKKIGIIGGGPAGLFLYKRLVDAGREDLEVSIFERKSQLGAGMPYSSDGAGDEHITNVSDNELPPIVSSMKEWLPTAAPELLERFHIDPANFNEYKVVPRLLFGEYLSAQFTLLLNQAKKQGVKTRLFCETEITDIRDEPEADEVQVTTASGENHSFDAVIVCTGHRWPKVNEGRISNWFDSPYPPAKLELKVNFPVAIKGASLTAIDAVRTLARHNGKFIEGPDGKLRFELAEDSRDFRLVMHSLGGLLPAIRFHLEDPELSRDSVLSQEEVFRLMENNDGFVPLDYLFEHNFKQPLRRRNPEFYEQVKDLSIEAFVGRMMELRERLDPFVLFAAEYAEAERSIRQQRSVNWKEELAVLSYAMNYPAKHLSAEDMLRLRKLLLPLISIIIAFVPQSSARELMALHAAGVLSLQEVDQDSQVEPLDEGGAVYRYKEGKGQDVAKRFGLYIDATGQPPFFYGDLPFAGLKDRGTVSPAHLRFRSAAEGEQLKNEGNQEVVADVQGNYYLRVPGISINDQFQVLDRFGVNNKRIYMMAVPYIGGLNPDYSGLDFCDAASLRISTAILEPAKITGN